MSYESKLYIVDKGWLMDDDGMVFADVVATYDMCKCYFLSDVLIKEQKTNCYFFADDGNTKILEDKYGDALTETSIDHVISILEEAVDAGEEYRRIFPLLAMLRSFREQEKQHMWRHLAVLHYGY